MAQAPVQNQVAPLTMRDRFIIAQALLTAIEVLKAVPAPYTEVSNIEDMEYLAESHLAFAPFAEMLKLSSDVKANLELQHQLKIPTIHQAPSTGGDRNGA